jgi:hypothetical protein
LFSPLEPAPLRERLSGEAVGVGHAQLVKETSMDAPSVDPIVFAVLIDSPSAWSAPSSTRAGGSAHDRGEDFFVWRRVTSTPSQPPHVAAKSKPFFPTTRNRARNVHG